MKERKYFDGGIDKTINDLYSRVEILSRNNLIMARTISGLQKKEKAIDKTTYLLILKQIEKICNRITRLESLDKPEWIQNNRVLRDEIAKINNEKDQLIIEIIALKDKSNKWTTKTKSKLSSNSLIRKFERENLK